VRDEEEDMIVRLARFFYCGWGGGVAVVLEEEIGKKTVGSLCNDPPRISTSAGLNPT